MLTDPIEDGDKNHAVCKRGTEYDDHSLNISYFNYSFERDKLSPGVFEKSARLTISTEKGERMVY
jgi:hypothetical protein